MTWKSVITGLVSITVPFQLACGTPAASVAVERVEYYSDSTLVMEMTSQSPFAPANLMHHIAWCGTYDDNHCDEIIKRLNDGETVIVQDALYYNPFIFGALWYEPTDHPLIDYSTEMGLDNPPSLINRIQPIPDTSDQWIVEVLILHEDILYRPHEFIPNNDSYPNQRLVLRSMQYGEHSETPSTDYRILDSIYDWYYSDYPQYAAENGLSPSPIPDISHITYHGPLIESGLGVRACMPMDQLENAIFEDDR